MKKLLILVSLTAFSFSNAIAVTLYDALNQTYQNNRGVFRHFFEHVLSNSLVSLHEVYHIPFTHYLMIR